MLLEELAALLVLSLSLMKLMQEGRPGARNCTEVVSVPPDKLMAAFIVIILIFYFNRMALIIECGD